MASMRRVRWNETEDEADNIQDTVLPAAEPWPYIPNTNTTNNILTADPSTFINTTSNTTNFLPQRNAYLYDEEDDSDDQTNSEEEDQDLWQSQLYARNQTLNSAPPEITHERLEWQQMLQSVLMGEVIKSEKKRLSSTDKFQQLQPTQEIWLNLRALLRGRTVQQEQKCLDDSRKEIEGVLKMVLDFKIEKGSEDTALRKVAEVLKNVDRIESLYTTRAQMIAAHPDYGATEFQTKLDALNAWCTVTRSLSMQYKILRDWTGSEDLQIARPNTEEKKTNDKNETSSFVERLLKESALQDTFDKRTLSALNTLLLKSKQTMIVNAHAFEEMNLPPFISQLRQLATFPTSLVEEALKLRLEYKDRMNEPPKQMVDAMMEDYRGLLSLACRVKLEYQELTHPTHGWNISDENGDEGERDYDQVLMESVRFYFKLITWKLNLEKENNLRECEVMEKEWDFLKGTVCQTVDKSDWECAEQFW
jgi:mitogen-activated protein kinase kinase kinase